MTMFGKELIKSRTADFLLYVTWDTSAGCITDTNNSSVCTGRGQPGQPVCLLSQCGRWALTHGCSCCSYKRCGLNSCCFICGAALPLWPCHTGSTDLRSALLHPGWSRVPARRGKGQFYVYTHKLGGHPTAAMLISAHKASRAQDPCVALLCCLGATLLSGQRYV